MDMVKQKNPGLDDLKAGMFRQRDGHGKIHGCVQGPLFSKGYSKKVMEYFQKQKQGKRNTFNKSMSDLKLKFQASMRKDSRKDMFDFH
jgi:hypothetical protein